MKKFLICFAALAAVTASCKKDSLHEEQTEGIVSIAIDCGSSGTRADTPNLSPQDYETAIRSVDILIFNEKGQLNVLHHTETVEEIIKVSVSTGQKDIWTVINGPDLSSVVRVADLRELKTMLEDNIVSGTGKGFVMVGNRSWNVTPTSEDTPCIIDVHRFAARVALTQLNVQLPSGYENVKINNVMLINVVANQRLDGTATPSVWYNKKGLTASGAIMDGSTGRSAEQPELTFKTSGATVKNNSSLPLTSPWYFYGYPNPTVSDSAEADGSFKAEQTRLVVSAEINGETFFYPVTLPTFERNKAYEVELTIKGLGSDSPDIIPEKGNVNATVTIKPWDPGAIVNEII